MPVRHADARRGDQLWFVADTTRLQAAVGWKPRIAWQEGIGELCAWLAENCLEAERPTRIVA